MATINTPTRNETINTAIGMSVQDQARRGYPGTTPEIEELAETGRLRDARDALMRKNSKPTVDELEDFEAYEDYKPGLVCIKPIRHSGNHNPTFKRFNRNLWCITAKYPSKCPLCNETIQVGERISLFNKGGTWAHTRHAELGDYSS